MTILGSLEADLIECSEVIGTPPSGDIPPAHLPAGLTMNDIEQAVSLIHAHDPIMFDSRETSSVCNHSLPFPFR